VDATEACPSRSIALFSFRQTSSTMMAEMKPQQMQEVIGLRLRKAQGWLTIFSPTLAWMMSRMHSSKDEFLVDLELCPLARSVNPPQRKSDYGQFKIIHENSVHSNTCSRVFLPLFLTFAFFQDERTCQFVFRFSPITTCFTPAWSYY